MSIKIKDWGYEPDELIELTTDEHSLSINTPRATLQVTVRSQLIQSQKSIWYFFLPQSIFLHFLARTVQSEIVNGSALHPKILHFFL